jgi:hypothetical protein
MIGALIMKKMARHSAHDTCDYGLKRFKSELKPETIVLRAGATYSV